VKYLKITNRGSLNRKDLELVGSTTKRDRLDDEAVIGHKGSGTKLSTVAALRLGLQVAVTSTDYLGSYYLAFDTEEVDIGGRQVRQIHFNYFEPTDRGELRKSRQPWFMTLDAFQDWDQPIGNDGLKAYKVLREFICNAFDEDKGFRIEYVDRPSFAPPGETSVYILNTPEVRQVFDRVSRYFKFLATEAPLVRLQGLGSIFTKSEPKNTRLFVLGVMVECTDDWWRHSLFDYSLSRKSLVSEERVIKSLYEYEGELGRLLAALTCDGLTFSLFQHIVSRPSGLEVRALSRVHAEDFSDRSREAWLGAVRQAYGDGPLCIATGHRAIDSDASQIYGYRVVGGDSLELRSFLKALGFPTASEIVPKKFEYRLVRFGELDQDSQRRFQEAFRMFARQFPDRARIPIVLYYPLDEKMRRAAGYAGIGEGLYKEIWLAALTPTSLGSVHDIFETLMHEGRHCVTKVDDYDRIFVRAAERDVTTVIYRTEGRDEFGPGLPVPPSGDPDRIRPNLVIPLRDRAKGSGKKVT